ncbi:uncharacterized protein BCR38DRAFT_473024 [Pseudomassariella vexata]|uniref:Uncharacterized protein n=1 Tax=Pseudomassariella vexata TaxID=1141098 RepID=A0A1Y2E7Y0_9PEZI|nr:uncharacterized protein BCR38DRAFT_473024 [Pseudomassariella vexata]ORY67671.1 hypothetical protein BCR38DRAFT_473024 [Pseudomassariella vexata]
MATRTPRPTRRRPPAMGNSASDEELRATSPPILTLPRHVTTQSTAAWDSYFTGQPPPALATASDAPSMPFTASSTTTAAQMPPNTRTLSPSPSLSQFPLPPLNWPLLIQSPLSQVAASSSTTIDSGPDMPISPTPSLFPVPPTHTQRQEQQQRLPGIRPPPVQIPYNSNSVYSESSLISLYSPSHTPSNAAHLSNVSRRHSVDSNDSASVYSEPAAEWPLPVPPSTLSALHQCRHNGQDPGVVAEPKPRPRSHQRASSSNSTIRPRLSIDFTESIPPASFSPRPTGTHVRSKSERSNRREVSVMPVTHLPGAKAELIQARAVFTNRLDPTFYPEPKPSPFRDQVVDKPNKLAGNEPVSRYLPEPELMSGTIQIINNISKPEAIPGRPVIMHPEPPPRSEPPPSKPCYEIQQLQLRPQPNVIRGRALLTQYLQESRKDVFEAEEAKQSSRPKGSAPTARSRSRSRRKIWIAAVFGTTCFLIAVVIVIGVAVGAFQTKDVGADPGGGNS